MLSGKEALAHSPFGVLCCTQDGRIVHANRKTARLLGYRSVEMLPLNINGLSSLLMPPGDCLALRETLKRRGILRNTIISITRANGSRTWLQVNAHISPTAEGNSLVIFHLQDVTRQVGCERQLLELSMTDPLTGLCNRRQFEMVATQGIQYATRNGGKLGLLYLDIDGFKKINDSHGHCFGDKVLSAFAQRISKVVRSTDVVARVGGDEFCVLASSISSVDGMHAIAQSLYCSMSVPLVVNGVELAVQASIGMAIYPFHGSTLGELIERADKNMYATKRSGLHDASATLPFQGRVEDVRSHMESC